MLELFEVDLEGLANPKPSPRRTPQCIQCGRFCHIISDQIEYDGWGNQNYVTFDCSACGVFTEGLW